MSVAWRMIEAAWPRDRSAAALTLTGEGEVAWLDSSSAGAPPPVLLPALGSAPARWSLLAGEPIATIEQRTLRTSAELRIGGRRIDDDPSGWKLWQRTHRRLPRWPVVEAAGLTPGWVGFAAFESVGLLEPIALCDGELPLLRWSLFDSAILLDEVQRSAWLLWADGLAEAIGAPVIAAAERLERWTAAASLPALAPPAAARRLHADQRPEEYAARVERALELIAAGEVYQINLAQRWKIEAAGAPVQRFAALRESNPAPFGALLAFESDGRRQAVASLSPERLLSVDGRAAWTSPIKGTRPRSGDAVCDEAAVRELLASTKEAAELAMIVDLHRNDLGRVCEYGSVRVSAARRVEAHPTVFHTVADVTGRIRSERDALDALVACFPAGSICGVPKIQAIRWIAEIEPTPRGVYTGAVGWLGLDGRMAQNVAIRTVQFHEGEATLHAGGGIVAESDPGAEYAETLAKARGILRAFGLSADD